MHCNGLKVQYFRGNVKCIHLKVICIYVLLSLSVYFYIHVYFPNNIPVYHFVKETIINGSVDEHKVKFFIACICSNYIHCSPPVRIQGCFIRLSLFYYTISQH